MLYKGSPIFLATYEVRARKHVFYGYFVLASPTKEIATALVARDLFSRYNSSDMSVDVRLALQTDLDQLGVDTEYSHNSVPD